MPIDQIGIVSALQAKRAAVIAANPHVAAKVLGKKPDGIACKTHAITVDLRTGKRTVSTASEVNPFIVPKKPDPAPPPRTIPPTIYRPDGVRAILAVCAKHWEVGVPALMGPGRSHRLAHPRFAAMVLIQDLVGLSTTAIGRAIGRRDHTTILSGFRRAAWLLENDADWAQRYALAATELKTPAMGVPAGGGTSTDLETIPGSAAANFTHGAP